MKSRRPPTGKLSLGQSTSLRSQRGKSTASMKGFPLSRCSILAFPQREKLSGRRPTAAAFSYMSTSSQVMLPLVDLKQRTSRNRGSNELTKTGLNFLSEGNDNQAFEEEEQEIRNIINDQNYIVN